MDPQVVDNSWANRRRAVVLGVVVLVLTGIGFAIFWYFWYKPPTCFDKTKNGDETGIDCGGSCSQICNSDMVQPIVRWDPRMFEVSTGLWNMLVYVENPNANIDATYAPYTLTVIGDNNEVLYKKEGATILPKNKTVGIFEGGIIIKNDKQPKRAIFELGNKITWQKNENTGEDITITHGTLQNLDSAPKVSANIKNNGAGEIKNIELVIAVFDGSDNAIAASRTFVEDLKKNENADVVFTWPRSFQATPARIEITYKIFGNAI
jgi:hypothetical protein